MLGEGEGEGGEGRISRAHAETFVSARRDCGNRFTGAEPNASNGTSAMSAICSMTVIRQETDFFKSARLGSWSWKPSLSPNHKLLLKACKRQALAKGLVGAEGSSPTEQPVGWPQITPCLRRRGAAKPIAVSLHPGREVG